MAFTQDEFFAVFAAYNTALWPAWTLAYLLGLVAVRLLFVGTRTAAVWVSLILAVMWAVNGVGYHWFFFAEVNPLARVFAVAFVAQAALLAVAPLPPPGFHYKAALDLRTVAALGLVVFAMVVYPIWSWRAGHAYPAMPMFGVAPCPTTIFTIGLLLLAPWRVARWLVIIPALWALIGGTAAVLLDVPQDFGLMVALLVALLFGLASHSRPGANLR